MPAKRISSRQFEEITIREISTPVNVLQGLNIPPHDFIEMVYTASNLTTVRYRVGGAAGTIVCTLTLTYDGANNPTSVTRT
jgi:hypothetical protein